MSGFDAAAELLPGSIKTAASAIPEGVRAVCEEFRLRLGRHPSVTTSDGELPLYDLPPVVRADLDRVLELATRASPYAAAESMEQGFVTARGGVRVGLCGRKKPGSGWAMGSLTSVCIRIPREVRGCAEPFASMPFPSTLILSPPGGGKTTLLRDMVRLLSDKGLRISLCDERGEIAAGWEGGFGFDVGKRTDVLSDAPRREAAVQLLRTMSPQVLAMDEITAACDADACRMAAGCGVKLLATAHADTAGSVLPAAVTPLMAERIFTRLIRIRRNKDKREYAEQWL